MQVVQLLACLAALALGDLTLWETTGEGSLGQIVGLWPRAAVGLAALTLGPFLAWRLTHWAETRLKDRPGDRYQVVARLNRWHAWQIGLCVVGGLTPALLGWGETVRQAWSGSVWLPGGDELLILAPTLLPMLLSWTFFHGVERALHGTAHVPNRWAFVVDRMRTHWGVLFAPLVLLLAFDDLRNAVWPDDESPTLWWVYCTPLAALLLGFPQLLRRVWATRRLPQGDLRDRLELACLEMRVQVRDLLVWGTGGRMGNAAVVGLFRWHRLVLLGDALLLHLDDDELEAVLAHEAGHVRLHHVALRLLAASLPLNLLAAASSLLPTRSSQIMHHLGTQSPWTQALGLLIGGLLAGGYLYLVFGSYSRLLELQADLFACRRSGVDVFSSALEKVGILNGLPRNRADWQHDSIAYRLDWMRRSSLDPELSFRFDRRLSQFAFVLLSLSVVSAAMWMISP